MVEAARKEELMTIDQYPYTASSIIWADISPSWALAGDAEMHKRTHESCDKKENKASNVEEPEADNRAI
jgi:hypothetical protein